MNLFITGATGFVGRFLCTRLLADGLHVRGTLLESESPSSLVVGVEPVIIQPLGPDTVWGDALAGVDTVIHLAARVHIMDDPAADPQTEFRRVNVEGTLKLAREAAKAGAKRFVFISSIKVNGEETATLPKKQFKMVQAWIEIHKEELLVDWELAVNGDDPFRIAPLQ